MTPFALRDLDALLTKSRAVITGLQEPGGAYPASPSFSAYRGYCWFRDGSFIADGVSAAGDADSASAFFDWCSHVLHRHEDWIGEIVAAAAAGTPVPDARMLPTRFTFDGDPGHDEWWDFQLDGYGTWLWAVVAHAHRHGLDVGRWRRAAELTVDYLLCSWHRPCYDWWEEHASERHVSTLGCVAAGLTAAAESGLVVGDRAERARAARAEIDGLIAASGTVGGRLTKWLGSHAVDGSLSALVAPLGYLDADSPVARATVEAVERELCVEGGVHRFLDDTFYGGGRWPLLTCFLGLAQLATGDRAAAERSLAWSASAATDEGLLPEQVDGRLLDPTYRQEWLERWGPVATPLLWSHAMLLRLAAALEENP